MAGLSALQHADCIAACGHTPADINDGFNEIINGMSVSSSFASRRAGERMGERPAARTTWRGMQTLRLDGFTASAA